MVNGGLMSC